MRDLVVEEILRAHISQLPQTDSKARRGYAKPVIPVANRYPHSVLRAELEMSRQPWSRGMLGGSSTGSYGRPA